MVSSGDAFGTDGGARRAIDADGVPDKVSIDKSRVNKAGVEAYNDEAKTGIAFRQCKYLNNIVEQDHRFVKQKMVTPAELDRIISPVCDSVTTLWRPTALSYPASVASS